MDVYFKIHRMVKHRSESLYSASIYHHHHIIIIFSLDFIVYNMEWEQEQCTLLYTVIFILLRGVRRYWLELLAEWGGN